MLTTQELRSSTLKELLQELESSRKEMLKIRVNIKTKQEKDSAKSRKTKRYIAQILTVLKELNADSEIMSDKDSKQAEGETVKK